MIRAENISMSFGDRQVLKEISAVFEPGKTNLIIGKSGSGKTVFLKCLVACWRLTRGRYGITTCCLPASISMEERR